LLDKRGESYQLRSGRDLGQTLDETRVVWHNRLGGQGDAEQESDDEKPGGKGEEKEKEAVGKGEEKEESDAVDMTDKDRENVKDVRSWQQHTLEENVAKLKGWFPKDWHSFCAFGLPAQLCESSLYCDTWIRESLAGPRKDGKRKKNTGRHERRERDKADRARKSRKTATSDGDNDDDDGPDSEDKTAESSEKDVVQKLGDLVAEVRTLLPSSKSATPGPAPGTTNRLNDLQVKMQLLQRGVDLGLASAKKKMEELMQQAIEAGLFDMDTV
jgi:hypothetical protein